MDVMYFPHALHAPVSSLYLFLRSAQKVLICHLCKGVFVNYPIIEPLHKEIVNLVFADAHKYNNRYM